MKLPRHTVATALARKSLEFSDYEQFGAEIAAYLLSERRVGELNSIMRDIALYRAKHGIVEVVAVSAHQLDDAAHANIREQIQIRFPDAKHIIISHRLDASMLGGVRLEFANQQLDLSVRNKLNRLKQLTSNASA